MQEQLEQLLSGRRGHFLMESGLHASAWYELDRLMADRERLRPFVSELALRLSRHGIGAVCGPMTGGAKLAAMIAMELGIPGFFAERFAPEDTAGLFRVSYRVPAAQREKLAGRRCAIVDDAISAGSALRGTYADLLACGAQPVVCGSLFLFGHAIDSFVREHALAVETIAPLDFDMWLPEACPLCRQSLPLENVADA